MSLSTKFPRKRTGRLVRTENGFSLLELLLAMGIFAVIAAATVSIIVMLNNSAAKFQNTTTTQNELNTAMNRIQVDISQATSLDTGAKNYIGLNSTQNAGTAYKTYIFYYDGTTDNIPDGADTSNLPPSNKVKGAIIEQVFQSGTFKSQNILVGGYQPSPSWNAFFQFYSANGSQYGKSGDKLSSDDVANVVKIQFALQSKVSDRTTPIELASAASINSYVQGLSYTGNQPQIPQSTVLSGNLQYADGNNPPSSDGTVTAILNWNQVPGADSYTIYRIHEGDLSRRDVVLNPQTTTWQETGLVYGETYDYYIVVNGASGQSAESNHWSMTVRPPKAVIVNVNTLKGLSDVKQNSNAEVGDVSGFPVLPGYEYTVARNLSNQITWAPSNGALDYTIYRDGMQIANIAAGEGSAPSLYSYVDTNAAVTYGTQHSYTVIPHNTGQNGTGGNGVQSDPVVLVSPPSAPVISSTQSDGTSGTLYNTINTVNPGQSAAGAAYVKGNYLYSRSVGQGQTLNCANPATNVSVNNVSRGVQFTSTGGVQDQVNFGVASCYQATAYNDAGESPLSNATITHTRPSDFSIVNKDVNAQLDTIAGNGERYTVARGLTNQISWTDSQGATGYYVYRDGTLIQCANIQGTVVPAGTTYCRDTNLSYGDVHTYTVTAFSKWGDDSNYQRTTNASNDPSATLVSPPVAPSIDASAYGSDSGNPYNTVTLTGTVSNADGYRLYRNTDTSAVPDCSNPGYTGQNFGTNQGSQINNGVDWGSATCYRAKAYNAAGDGPWSNIPTVYVGPAGFSLQNTGARGVDLPNLSATNNGYQYTVAKNLTDSVTWNYTSGADNYTVVRNGGDVATVGSGTSNYQEGTNYGDQRTFSVRATSVWSGTNFTISRSTGSAQLNSPPTAPSINAVATDPSAGNQSSSQNDLYVTGYGQGVTTSVRLFGWSSGSAKTGCNSSGSDTWSYPRDDMGSIYDLGFHPSTTTRANYDVVNWGTSSCYYATAYNDAGQGQTSGSDTDANQKPGAFAIPTTYDNYKYLNINATYSSTTTCTGDGGKGSVDYCYATSGTDDFNHEVFDGTTITDSGVKYRNISSSLSYIVDWNGAPGVGNSASKAYNVHYDENDCADRSKTLDVDQPIGSGQGTSLNETSLTPGCTYTATVTAYANNGLTRDSSKNIVTAPDVPSSANNYILRTYAASSTTNWGRRLQDVRRNTGRGDATISNLTVYNRSVWTNGSANGQDASDTATISAGNDLSIWTPAAHPTNDGNLTSNSYSQSMLTQYGITTSSLNLKFKGSIGQGACGTSCGTQWGTAANPAPATVLAESDYTDNYHPRYKSAD